MKIGIDLGTTSTLVACLNERRQPDILTSQLEGNSFLTPSVIHLDGNKAYVGQSVFELLKNRPGIQVLQFFKRNFGKPDALCYDSEGNAWYPEGLAALMLKKVLMDVKTAFGDRLEGAVITVPAHFDEEQKLTVLDAARLLNLKVLDLIEEPLAAALHYQFKLGVFVKNEKILVYDLGGGTFDVTVIASKGEQFEVLAKDGITDLGGKEFDDKMKEIILRKFEQVSGVAFSRKNPFDMQELSRLAENLKKDFSMPGKKLVCEVVSLENRAVEIVIHKDEFEREIAPMIERSLDVCKKCLQSIQLNIEDIHRVLLVGGSSFIPLIKRRLQEVFHFPHQKTEFHEPLKAVAFGAALRANEIKSAKSGSDAALSDLTEYYYGVKSYDFKQQKVTLSPIVMKNQPVPVAGLAGFYKSRPEQQQMRFEISRYRENTLDPEQAKVEVLGELVVNGLQDKPSAHKVELKLSVNKEGELVAEADSGARGEKKQEKFGHHFKNKPWLPLQKALVERAIIVNQW